jgi:cytochrome c peroxidase
VKLYLVIPCAVLFAGFAHGQTTDEEWQAKALESYPELATKGSPLNEKFVKLYNERKKANPGYFKTPEWPFLLASEVAAGAASPPAISPAASDAQQQRGGPGRGRGRRGLDDLTFMSVPSANPMTPGKVELGRKLFFGTDLSADHTVSCATCHDPSKAFADGAGTAHGINGAVGVRNTPSLVNAGYGRTFFWDGRAATLEEQVLGPIFNPKEMGLTQVVLEKRTGLAAADVADALASYVRTIRSQDCRYDWYVAGQTQVLTEIERTGLDLFRGKGRCARCHSGANFTDEEFHNTGLGWKKDRFVDEGRYAVTGDSNDHGAFKTPTLREIANTAPYMHDGSLATLEDVVDFYSRGGRANPALDRRMRPINFTKEEKAALVAFLRTLSGRVSDGFATSSAVP